jgi:hypothetical protein
VLAPVATSVQFMLVFWLAFGERRGDAHGTGFAAFLAPGILMMSVIQNAFANTSSSIIVAKVQGNIVDTLMPPLSPAELLAGYTLGGATRGVACALVTGVLIFPASFRRRAGASAAGRRLRAVGLADAVVGRGAGLDRLALVRQRLPAEILIPGVPEIAARTPPLHRRAGQSGQCRGTRRRSR